MSFCYRKTRIEDIDALFEVRSKTRENPISKERLAQMGITSISSANGFKGGELCGWVCLEQETIIGFCTGHIPTGEILVLALLPDFEGHGIGRTLLSRVVAELQKHSSNSVWLSADPNPAIRAHGFYRRLGWKATGNVLENGDEILEFYSSVKLDVIDS
ncbi:hypothetical protein LCGC14_0209900 [marine sediment metagenome]|uniref:N-acetyltransferase domain-containing protein n=1 Tax=marine sediment metagenome TaxID=412755 RepID=A0A0F9UXE6_9ZZZZ|nr:GNAT family N-acetyltransferase [Halomonas sp.]HDZ48232.1 GNAT family N-acetyltransferase [Halomonas sp.]HEB03498.1 GNAT family N-acetyltransferase [Halomonas sp.]